MAWSWCRVATYRHPLTKYRAEGMRFAALDVDSANPTGAFRLYESLGFRLWREFVHYQRVISA